MTKLVCFMVCVALVGQGTGQYFDCHYSDYWTRGQIRVWVATICTVFMQLSIILLPKYWLYIAALPAYVGIHIATRARVARVSVCA